MFGTMDPSVGTAILTFSGTRSALSDSLQLTDVAHHHLAVGIVAMLVGHLLQVNPLGVLGTTSLHFELALSLAALGTASSFTANHLDAFPPYAFLTRDLVAMASLYTHHQFIAGFFMAGAFAHGAIYLIRDQAAQTVWTQLYTSGPFLGFHTLGLYVHNDVVIALGLHGSCF